MVRAFWYIFFYLKEHNESVPSETENNEDVDTENEECIEETKTEEYVSKHNENIETLEDNTIEKMINEEIGNENDSTITEEQMNDKENHTNKVENDFQNTGILLDSIINC